MYNPGDRGMIPHRRCWAKDDAFEVLNIDAEAIDDAVFRAVHFAGR